MVNMIVGAGPGNGGLQADFRDQTGEDMSEIARQLAKLSSAQNYTLLFSGIQTPSVGPTLGPVPGTPKGQVICEAKVIWSVEGNDVQRYITVVDGTSICAPAQACKVSLYDFTPASTGFMIASAKYSVTVLASPGTRASPQQPPIWVPPPYAQVSIPNGGPPQVYNLAPPNNQGPAGITMVNVSVLANPPAPIPEGGVTVKHFAGTTILKSYDPRVTPWVPIAAGADSVQVFNNFTTPIQVYLVFGVDG
jgi:hypothetical protein